MSGQRRGDVGIGGEVGREGGRGTYLEELRHGSPLLFGDCFVFLLDHAQPAYGELELDFDFALSLG